jgi:multiple sugar transport system substrate-binding protein
MTTIEFSCIPDTDAECDFLLELLADFKKETGIVVRINRMNWGNAWDQLIGMAMKGEGADISHVGSTWVSSLVSINALRPLPPHLLARIGGAEAFIPATWQSAVIEEDRNPWSIPFNTHIYAIAYRRDLLQAAGLDEATAFATPSEVEKTVCRLEELHCAEKAWLMPSVRFPAYNDMTHTAASWIWSSGGHLIGNHAREVLFDSPATLTGLKAYFRLLRRQLEATHLQTSETMQHLIEGRAAAVLTDARTILICLEQGRLEAGNIGTASVMGTPWSGGGHLIIWRHTYGDPEHLEAACKLAEFLTSGSTMLEIGRKIHTLPARVDALNELIPPEHLLRPVVTQLVSSGRSYRAIRLWRFIENHFGQRLDLIAQAVLEEKDADWETVLTENMKALTKRLNLTLA